ncbi:MAG TPA: CDP-alcohol phosphatidyltransferase family protein [Acidimicrobiales bacterium]|nr:CDP-alcohol phosphatidyltransferase family protein [Acidimicrobiales bacterium]
MTTATKPFGPSAIATPANALTMGRLVAAPVFAVALTLFGPSSWVLWALWSLLAASDSVDGHLARRHGTTVSGAFLDPLADKFLVVAALCALIERGLVPAVAVALVVARELLMSLFRTYAARRSVSIPARPLGKAKALLQDIAVGLFLFPPTAHHLAIDRGVLWAAVALTLLSGLQYLRDGRALLAGGGA